SLPHASFRVSWRLLVFLLDEPRNRYHLVVVADVDDLDPLRGAADGADVVGQHPQDHALLRDDQQLVAGLDVGDADDGAVAVGGGDVDDADPAARLDAILLDLGALAVAALGHRQQGADRLHRLHGDDVIVAAQRDAADAVGGAAHRPHVGLLEADRHAVARADEHLAGAVGLLHGNHRVALLDAHRDDAAGARVAEAGQRGLLDHAAQRPHDDELVFLELFDRQRRRDLLAFLHRHQVGDRLALAVGADVRDLVDLQPVGAAAVRENHDVGVRRGDEQVADEVLGAGAHADAPLAAAALVAVGRDRRPLDVAGVADGDRHVLFGDQVLDVDLAGGVDDFGAPLVAVPVARFRHRLGAADQGNHRVEVIERGLQPLQDVIARLGLAQVELGTAADDL